MFAMTINVGMVVHDKINLQNSVDFASIYVAQRQAEQLNAIAHMNYQIRQAHKLLSFRYVVLGTAGIERGPISNGTVQNNESLYPLADKMRYPSCFASNILLQEIRGDNWCKKEWFAGGFGGIPKLNVVNPFMGGNYGLQQTTVQLGSDIQRDAMFASFYNWWHAAVSMGAFRLQIAYRKALVKALAANLSKPINANGMKDLYGESVYEGARKTFEYNLSESNRAAQNFSFQVRNSLEGINPTQWLPEIKTWIALIYADRPISGCNQNGCVGQIIQRFYYQLPIDLESGGQYTGLFNDFLDRVDPDEFLRQFTSANVPPGSDYEEVLGFEKNPWYMVYNQVRANTTSNALFNPMRGTPMSAQAFSKPFGGRIGPWYSKNWPSGSNISTGPKTVELWSPRKLGASGPADLNDPTFLPNSPKYPNDRFGWTSYLGATSTGKIGNNPLIFEADYNTLVMDLYPSGTGNGLAKGAMRDREMAAVAPDLFDIYYYSVDPNFHENYLEGKLDRWLMQEAQFTDVRYSSPRIWRDFGFSMAASNHRSFSVHNQLTQSTRQQLGPQVFFALESNDANGRANLLTSWVGGVNVNEYRSPASGTVSSRFGKCRKFYSGGKVNVPGECIENGGRTGYSVKMVSKDYLTSSQHSLGNAGSSTGPILNPPQD